jgi:hypothetical protein
MREVLRGAVVTGAVLLLAGCAASGQQAAPQVTVTVVATVTADASAPASTPTSTPAPASPSATVSSSKSCDQWQAEADAVGKSGTKAASQAIVDLAKKAGCTITPSGWVPSAKPTKSPGYRGWSRMSGVAYKWVKDPRCDYSSCAQLYVVPVDQGCPNGLYVSANLLRGGVVVDYGNDLVPSLSAGQKALLTLTFASDQGGKVQLTEINCY